MARILSVILLALALVACDTPAPTPAAAPTDTPIIEPTDTPEPVVEPTNTPEPEPTDTPESVEEPEATATPEPEEEPIETPAPEEEAAAVADFDSGGLGQSGDWWETNYGAGESAFGFLRHGDYDLMFLNGNAAYVERQWERPVPLDEAQLVMESMIPADSVEIEIYSPEGSPETTVYLYRSESLVERFDADDFIGGEPGEFIILYNIYEDGVHRAIVATGNNP
jgi:hypothetical protein